MIIAISSKGKTTTDMVDTMFGRCAYFQIIDTEKHTIKCVSNSGLEATGGAGIAAANQVIEEGVEAVISGKLGPNAFNIIDKANIKQYLCDKVTVEEAIDKFDKGELKIADEAGKSHRGM